MNHFVSFSKLLRGAMLILLIVQLSVPVGNVSASPLALSVGGCAVVSSGGVGLNVRSGPGTSYSLVGGLSDGTVVKITGGPTSANGYTWWQHDHGGWSAGNWLVDTSCPSSGGGGGGSGNIQLVDGLQFSPSSPQVGQSTSAYFKAKNNGSASITFGHLGVKCRRNSDNANYDYYWYTNVTLSPGQEFTYNTNRSFDQATSYWCTANYEQNGNWNDVKWSNGSTNYITINVQNAPAPTPTSPPPSPGNLVLTQDLSVSTTTPQVNQNITGSFKVKNTGGQAITIGHLGIQGRLNGDVNSTPADFNWVTNLTLQPGQEYTYSSSRSISTAGNWTLRPNYEINGTWSDVHRSDGTVNTVWITVQNVAPTSTPGNLVLTQDLSVSTTSPQVGQNITGSFKVKNTGGQAITIGHLGIQGRLNGDVNSTPADFNWITNLTLQPSEEYAYSSSRSISTAGNWTLRPNYEINNSWSDVHRSDGTVNTVWITVQTASSTTSTPRDQLPTSANPMIGSYYRLPVEIEVRAANSFSSPPYPNHLSAGTVVKIVDGPRLADNVTWWDLSEEEWGGGTGWFTMQSASPVTTPRDQLLTTSNPTVGSYYRLPVEIEVRAVSSFSSPSYPDHLYAGTVVKILDGPRLSEGATWWDLSEEEWGGGTGWFTTGIAQLPVSDEVQSPSSDTQLTVHASQVVIYDSCILSIEPVITGGCHSYVEFPLKQGTYKQETLILSSDLDYVGNLVSSANGPDGLWPPEENYVRFGLSTWDLIGILLNPFTRSTRLNELRNSENWILKYSTNSSQSAQPVGGGPADPAPAPVVPGSSCMDDIYNMASLEIPFLHFPVEGRNHADSLNGIYANVDHTFPLGYPPDNYGLNSMGTRDGYVVVSEGKNAYWGCSSRDSAQIKPPLYYLGPHYNPTEGWLWYDGHNGTDYSFSGDNMAVAAAAGHVVYYALNRPGYGNYVVVQHDEAGHPEIRTMYAHLARIDVTPTQILAQGDLIGKIGNTGCGSCGVHLHFSVFRMHRHEITNQEIWYPTDPYGFPYPAIDPLILNGTQPGDGQEMADWLWTDLSQNEYNLIAHAPTEILPIGGLSMIAAELEDSSGVINATPGESIVVWIKVRNVGIGTWSPQYPYALVNTENPNWTLPLLNSVDSGESYEWYISMAAPELPGTYQTTWVMQSSAINISNPMGVTIEVSTNTSTPSADSSLYNFEDGTTQGWSRGESITNVTNASTSAYFGTHSLCANADFAGGGWNSGYAFVNEQVITGDTITAKVYVPSGYNGISSAIYLQDANWGWYESSFTGLTPGTWTTLTWDLSGLGFVTPTNRIGFHIGSNSSYQGCVYIDSVDIVSNASPTQTPTLVPINTPTFTPTFTPTKTNTPLPTATLVPSSTPTLVPTNTPVPSPTASLQPTSTASSSGTELLTQPWHLVGSNGAAELYQSISSNALQGKVRVCITYDLHGLNALGGDASAIIFDQSGWKYVSLSNYGQNGLNGVQTVCIPLSDFPGLNPNASVGTLHTRFWYSGSFTVDITSIKAYSSSGATPTVTSTATFTPTPVNTLTPTQNTSQGTLTFYPVADASVFANAPTTNYGNGTTLETDNDPVETFLLKFNVVGLNGAMVTNAKLRLYNVNGSDFGGYFYKITDNSWTENGVTYDTRPAYDSSTIYGSLGAVSVNNWYEVNLTSLITGDGIYGIRVKSTSGDGADYSSREGANSPQLVITFSSSGTPTPTAAFTSTVTKTPTIPPTSTSTPIPTSTPTLAPTVTSGVELLSQPWHLVGNNGAAELYQSISSSALQGKVKVCITYDLHGLNALGGDASAIIFDQSGWRYISLSNYGQNGFNGVQTVCIPLSDFPGLNPNASVGTLHTRFWYSGSFTVDITSVKVYSSP